MVQGQDKKNTVSSNAEVVEITFIVYKQETEPDL